jgi:hypothetical protein
MAVPSAWALGGIGAQDRVLWKWDRDFYRRTEAFGKKVNRRLTIVRTIRQEQVNVGVDLIQQGR